MKYELAIFDMDGTILDTLEDLADSLNYALSLSDFPARTLEEVRSFVGNGIRKLIERATPAGTSPEDLEKVYTDFTAYYPKHCFDKTKPYSGIIEVIQELKKQGIKTAVVSNKADYAVQILCKQYFDGLFDFALGEQAGIQRKPAPDSVNMVLDKLRISRKNSVYIGDSDVDINTAMNAEIDCISVDWGFRDVTFLLEHGAKTIVSSPEKLLHSLI
ncbi:MAG: HAD-IA family hydrolase [Lachnospiraceae bacterium]|nr:HAD-IA family hydrolase [Lachnospiraceae bacterium]MBQ4522926.1 HAD-IA family hydrolase [Lachnospiraceae bacterium]